MQPPSSAIVSTYYGTLGNTAPETYPVSAINIQSNLCKSEISIPDNILYSGELFYLSNVYGFNV